MPTRLRNYTQGSAPTRGLYFAANRAAGTGSNPAELAGIRSRLRREARASYRAARRAGGMAGG